MSTYWPPIVLKFALAISKAEGFLPLSPETTPATSQGRTLEASDYGR